MNKNRRSGHQLTPEEEKTLGELVTMRKNLDKQRDSVVKEQKELKDKLKENTFKRRKDASCWYVPMDRLYRQNGVERENYHIRKFSGRPLQQIKKAALTIFTYAKVLIKKHKQEEISDAKIDEVCDEVIKLLTASYNFLKALLKDDPTDDQINKADIKKKTKELDEKV